MPAPATYTCNRCGYIRSLRYLPRAYVLDSDQVVPMEQRHFWCFTCKGISVAESLERDGGSIQMYADQLTSLQQLTRLSKEEVTQLKAHDRFEAERALGWIAEIQKHEADWKKWKEARSAPPKCLRCSNPVLKLPESDFASFQHGGCGGMLVCTMMTHRIISRA